MFSVKHMRMRMPPGFEHRAGNIARLVGQALAPVAAEHPVVMDRLDIGPLQIASHSSDEEIATHIAESLRSRLEGMS